MNDQFKGRVLVLGGRGMLGREVAVASRAAGYQTWVSGSEIDVASTDALRTVNGDITPHFVVNCAGVIPLKNRTPVQTIRTNALGPWCVRVAFPTSKIVNVSTDCVFDGTKFGAYSTADKPDAVDLYGCTKRMGEAEGLVNVRCSFIGHDHGLLPWLLGAEDGSALDGWDSALWNGGTVIDIAEGLIRMFDRLPGIHHLAGHATSKYSMLCDLAVLFDKNVTIIRRSTPVINRVLHPTVTIERQLDRLVGHASQRMHTSRA